MFYIIDGNNVAGKLKMLGEENFDKKLIEMIGAYNQERNSPVLLVFDGHEQMGDKIVIGAMFTVRYSPKDDYYESADDLIVEIVERNLNRKKEEITVITDDVGLKKRIEKIQEQFGGNVILERATRFAEKLIAAKTKADTVNDGKRGLSEEEQNTINDNLLRLWK